MSKDDSAGDPLEELFKEYGKPGEPDYHNNMGTVYRSRGQLEAAISEHREAIRLQPSREMFHCNLAIALAEKGEHEEALLEYQAALRLNPSDYHSHYSLGNLLSKLGRVDEAIAEYQRAIEADPERPEAHFNLAGTYFKRGQGEQAAFHYEASLAHDLEPQAALTAHLRLGGIYIDGNAWENAEKYLLRAVELAPDDFRVNYCLALVYLNIAWGELEWAARSKAVLFAKKALELDPTDEDAKGVAREAVAAFERVRPPGKAAPEQSGAEQRPWWQFWKK